MEYRKHSKIKNLKVRTTGLEKWKVNGGAKGDPKFMEVETFDTGGRSLVSQQSDLAAFVLIT